LWDLLFVLGLAADIDDLATAILAALGADAVGAGKLPAAWTLNQLWSYKILMAAAVATAMA